MACVRKDIIGGVGFGWHRRGFALPLVVSGAWEETTGDGPFTITVLVSSCVLLAATGTPLEIQRREVWRELTLGWILC